jgi:hypothetical protein
MKEACSASNGAKSATGEGDKAFLNFNLRVFERQVVNFAQTSARPFALSFAEEEIVPRASRLLPGTVRQRPTGGNN